MALRYARKILPYKLPWVRHFMPILQSKVHINHGRLTRKVPNRLQYLSDVHVDKSTVGCVPHVIPFAENLLICGDIGKPTHPNFAIFLSNMAKQFAKVLFVPGNHDWDCGPLYEPIKISMYNPIIVQICKELGVHYLNNNVHELGHNHIVAGSILWSRPLWANIAYSEASALYLPHIAEHEKHVNWLQSVTNNYPNKKVIYATHFVPTFKLIEPKYIKRGLKSTSWFASDLEHLMKKPVTNWICGHTHSVEECVVDNVHCAVNAHGYVNEKKTTNKENGVIIANTKVIDLE